MGAGDRGLIILNAQKPVELAVRSGHGIAQTLLENLVPRTALEMIKKQDIAMKKSAQVQYVYTVVSKCKKE